MSRFDDMSKNDWIMLVKDMRKEHRKLKRAMAINAANWAAECQRLRTINQALLGEIVNRKKRP